MDELELKQQQEGADIDSTEEEQKKTLNHVN